MRILVDSSNYFSDNTNLGDCAIFSVMCRRFREFQPGVRVDFITQNPQAIHEVCGPGVVPLLAGGIHSCSRFPLKGAFEGWRQVFDPTNRRRLAQAFEGTRDTVPQMAEFEEALLGADLVCATGGGFFSDAFPAHATGILDTLAGGLWQRKPVAMMSAGFEPVSDPALSDKSREVLPKLSLIACREGLAAPSLLEAWGAGSSRIMVTGDDAVEISYENRAPSLGTAIGVNLRQAGYSEVGDETSQALGEALRRAVVDLQSSFLPLPISLHGPSDEESIAKVLRAAGCDPPADTVPDLATLLRRVSQCRLVVTGSYHAAVFALSQGVPVVGLARSLHYRTKLAGVAHEFGGGCVVLEVDSASFGDALIEAMRRLWDSAAEMRPRLLEAARRQIEMGRSAYRRLISLAG